MSESSMSSKFPKDCDCGTFKDHDLMAVNPLTEQFEPTDAQPVRQHARMAGDPFQSQAQRGFMYANHPEIAKRWEKETPKGKLPYHKGK